MIKLSLNISDLVNYFLKVKENPAVLYDSIRENVASTVKQYLDSLMNTEITLLLGREPYQRKVVDKDKNYRNGHYERSFALKGIGRIPLKIPRDRANQYQTAVVPRYQRHEEQITRDVVMMYLGGLSTRNVEMISQRLLGCKVSSGFVSRCSQVVEKSVDNWRNRDLSDTTIRFIYVDGVNFDVRIGSSVEKTPVLVAIGVNQLGRKIVLGFQAGDKESATSWREFFKDLKRRGLNGTIVELGIMDGLPGLEKVFKDEFSNAGVQRCQVHVARNVLAKVPRKLKKEVADAIRDIFYASRKKRAMENFGQFKEKYEKVLPSAVKCLEKNVEKCLTYLKFDQAYWVSLRTTNPIERLNKEFRRRTKPMEIAGGEASLYNILTFVSLKMEIGWRQAPIQADSKKLKHLMEKFTQDY